MRWSRGRVSSLGMVLSASVLSACANVSHKQVTPDEAPVVVGPAVRDNRTPLDSAYRCYGQELASRLNSPLSVAVGAIQDYTGKYSDLEGHAITQGASPMIFSALYKLAPAVQLHDRFDTRVAELELAYMDKRRLGDGDVYVVDGRQVPWKPYFGGSIQQSDYYVVGGITELNYNIQSAGAEVRVGQTGPKARIYTMSIAADLRLVNTRTLVVESATSVQKQISGYEVGFEMFRFFDNIGGSTNLVDVNLGTKNQEPLQLGVRAVLELGTLDLLSDVSGIRHEACLPEFWTIPSNEELAEQRQAREMVAAAPAAESAQSEASAPAPEPVDTAGVEEEGEIDRLVAEANAEADADLARVTSGRFGLHDGFTRLVLTASSASSFEATATDSQVVVRVREARMEGSLDDLSSYDRILDSAAAEQQGDDLVITLRGPAPLEVYRSFTLSANGEAGRRIVVDVARVGDPPPGRVSSNESEVRGDDERSIKTSSSSAGETSSDGTEEQESSEIVRGAPRLSIGS